MDILNYLELEIKKLFEKEVTVNMQDAEDRLFPFTKAYSWQVQAIDKIFDIINNTDKNIILRAPTGVGKTPVLLTLALSSLLRRKRCIHITPRNVLQDQILLKKEYTEFFEKYDKKIYVLKARKKYACNKILGDEPACMGRFIKKGRGSVFYYMGELYKYPCEDCEYERIKEEIVRNYLTFSCLPVLNHGNFWFLRKVMVNGRTIYPDLVIVDEADLVADELKQGVGVDLKHLKLRAEEDETAMKIYKKIREFLESNLEEREYILALKDILNDIISFYRMIYAELSLLKEEEKIKAIIARLKREGKVLIFNKVLKKSRVEGLKHEEEMISVVARIINQSQDEIENKLRLLSYYRDLDNLYAFERNERFYIKHFDLDVTNVFERLFPYSKIILTSATVTTENTMWETVEGGVEFPKSRIFVCPLERITFRNLSTEEKRYEVLKDITENFIIKLVNLFERFSQVYYANPYLKLKVVIHCGGIESFGEPLAKILESNGLKVILHEKEKQAETVKKFMEGDYSFLIVAGLERGVDFAGEEYGIQFIIKVPYAQLYTIDIRDGRVVKVMNPELLAIQRMLGKKKFHEWYEVEAGIRLIQACGRNSRDPKKVSVTVILDERFLDNYKHLEKAKSIPKWFKDRLVFIEKKKEGEEEEGKKDEARDSKSAVGLGAYI